MFETGFTPKKTDYRVMALNPYIMLHRVKYKTLRLRRQSTKTFLEQKLCIILGTSCTLMPTIKLIMSIQLYYQSPFPGHPHDHHFSSKPPYRDYCSNFSVSLLASNLSALIHLSNCQQSDTSWSYYSPA